MGAGSRKVVNAVIIAVTLALWLIILRFSLGLDKSPESKTLSGLCIFYALALWGPFFLFSRQPVVARCARFLMTTLAIALVVGMIELLVVFGLVDFRRVFNTPFSDLLVMPINKQERELLFIRMPNLRMTWTPPNDMDTKYRGDLDTFELRSDRNGFRNPDGMDRADIVVVGDSYVESIRTREEKMMTTLLSKKLGVPVANLGQSGYGPQQELVALKRYGLPLKPKTVVWIFFEGNDIGDAERYAHDYSNWDQVIAEANSFGQRSFSRNLLATLYNRLSSTGYPLTYQDRVQTAWFKKSDGREETLLFLYPGYPVSKTDDDTLNNLVMPTLRTTEELCRRAEPRAKLVFVFAPTKFRVCEGERLRRPPRLPIAAWAPSNLPEIIDKKLKAVVPDVQFIDLTPHMRKYAQAGELLYFARDTHWSPRGQEVVAEILANEDLLAPVPVSPPPASQSAAP